MTCVISPKSDRREKVKLVFFPYVLTTIFHSRTIAAELRAQCVDGDRSSRVEKIRVPKIF